MNRVILLDAGPLGYALTPRVNETHRRCAQWLRALVAKGEVVAIAEIADYECRRGWLRTNNTAAIADLDQLKTVLSYVPITTGAMLKAAEFWAQARKRGYAPMHEGGANFGFFDGHARWNKVKLAGPKCAATGSGTCAADIDPDPFYSKWRYREAGPITRF